MQAVATGQKRNLLGEWRVKHWLDIIRIGDLLSSEPTRESFLNAVLASLVHLNSYGQLLKEETYLCLRKPPLRSETLFKSSPPSARLFLQP